jgi:hypothetical protein
MDNHLGNFAKQQAVKTMPIIDKAHTVEIKVQPTGAP